MHTIDIAYRSPLVPILGRRHLTRTLPSSWAEIQPAAAWSCMHHLMHAAPRQLLLDTLLPLPYQINAYMDPAVKLELLQCLDWMQIDQLSTTPIAPYYDHRSKNGRRTRLYLPGASFKNVVAGEYAMISDLYEVFKKDQDSDIESRMIAIMLRPAGLCDDPASDPRVRLLSSEQTWEWLPLVRSLPDSIRAYMTTLISANTHYIYESYRDWLFTNTTSASEEDGAEVDPPEGLNFGWWGAFMDIAQDGTFGDYNQVLNTPIHSICMYLMMKIDKARREKQEMEHARVRAGM